MFGNGLLRQAEHSGATAGLGLTATRVFAKGETIKVDL